MERASIYYLSTYTQRIIYDHYLRRLFFESQGDKTVFMLNSTENKIPTANKGLQSKRPQVKTSPSQNVPELVKTSPKIGQNVPMVKNVGQNVPKKIFLILCFMYFSKNLGCLNKTVSDKVFLSRFHSVISIK